MLPELETLFMALRPDDSQTKFLFINARYHPDLERFDDCRVIQHFKPHAAELKSRGFALETALNLEEAGYGRYGLVLVLLPKNITEARYMIAQGLSVLEDGGALVCAAGNKAGAGRLAKLAKAFGLEEANIISANKSKVLRAIKGSAVNQDEITKALSEGAPQPVLASQSGGAYTSQPGVFGWDKEDKGSALLAAHLPEGLSGQGADFGCGYGYLTRALAARCSGIRSMTCIDADARALACCAVNMQGVDFDCKTRWEDLTKALSPAPDFDFIVMNPPFHEGKTTDSDIGLAFIKTAHAALKAGGQLWMVANAHLPYEGALGELFSTSKKCAEQEGFKVYKNVK